MRIAITGANGFIGSNLTRYLMKKGHEVTALVRRTADVSLLPVKSKIKEIDYHNESSIISALLNQDTVIHCAALTRASTWEEMQNINVGLTERLVKSANETVGIRQLIFLSSQAAAGMGEKNKPKTEDDIPKPITWYGKSKLQAEEIIKNKSAVNWTIIRPVSVFGPGDKDFLQTFKLMKSHLSVSLGLKDKYVSLIYIDELSNFIHKCLDNSVVFNEVFFVSDGVSYTHKMFSDAMQSAVHTFSLHITVPDSMLLIVSAFGEISSKINPKPALINLQKFKELHGRYWTVSIDKARKLLDYNPNPNIIHQLHTTWLWYKEQGWL